METSQKAAKAWFQSSLFMKTVLVMSAEVSFMPVGGAAADFLTKYLKFFKMLLIQHLPPLRAIVYQSE